MIFFTAFFGVLGVMAAMWTIRYLYIVIPVFLVLVGIFVSGIGISHQMHQHDPETIAANKWVQQMAIEDAQRNKEASERIQRAAAKAKQRLKACGLDD